MDQGSRQWALTVLLACVLVVMIMGIWLVAY